MRQYERRIKFIRVGDAVRTAGWLKGEPMLSRRPWSIFYPGYMMQDRDLVGHLLIGWGTYTGFGERKANTFSLCGVGGETGYTAQEDLKFINSYNMGEGRTIRVLFFPFLLPRPSLGFFFFFLFFCPWDTTFPSIRVFSNESALHIRCPKYWSFSFSISPSNEYSGLIWETAPKKQGESSVYMWLWWKWNTCSQAHIFPEGFS